MATTASVFLIGMGTTFIVLGAGFSGGLFLANSALRPSPGQQAGAPAEAPSPVRVILPASAEAAQPPQFPAIAPERASPIEPVKAPVPSENKIAKPDARKAEAEDREHRKRAWERKARRQMARAKQQQPTKPPVMAFEAEEPRQNINLFGN
jgi:hypothetical protein